MGKRHRGLIFLATAVAGAALAAAPLAGAAKTPTVTVKGPGYSKVFNVVSCTNKGETDIALTGKATGLKLRLVGKNKTGTLRITGFADLKGKLTSIMVGDAGNIKVKGVFTSGGVKGPFTVTGSCA